MTGWQLGLNSSSSKRKQRMDVMAGEKGKGQKKMQSLKHQAKVSM